MKNKPRVIRCRNCNQVGHMPGQCSKPRKNSSCATQARKSKNNRDKNALKTTKYVAGLQLKIDSIYVDALVDNKWRNVLIDTGATKSIVRPDILHKSSCVKLTRGSVQTAIGQSVVVKGEAKVTFIIGK